MNTMPSTPQPAISASIVALSFVAGAAAPTTAQCTGVKLLASESAEDANLGHCVALDSRGQVAIAGIPFHDGPNGHAGATYGFSAVNGDWAPLGFVIPADSAPNDSFGTAVALSADGLTMLIGSIYDDSEGPNQGAGYVYTWNGSAWEYQAQLFSPDSTFNNQFGCSAALSSNGDIAVIGSRLSNPGGTTGRVYIFWRSEGTWSFQWEQHAVGPAGDYEFGRSMALSAAGDVLAVGAPFFDPGGINNAGAVQVFIRSGATWQHTQTLIASDPSASAVFGYDVAINAAGTRLLVGVRQDNSFGNNSGAAYVFDHDGRAWSQTVKLTAPDASSGDVFGECVALDGDWALIGARGEDVLCPCADDPNCDSGAAYLFRFERGQWSHVRKFFAVDAEEGASFGIDVAIGGQYVMIGAENDNEAAPDGGAVYFFDLADFCPANDINHDGTVDGIDLGILLSSWSIPTGAFACGGTISCPANLNNDCTVNGVDLGILLSSWTP